MILAASRIECGICFCTMKMGGRLHLDVFMDSSGVQNIYGKCDLCYTQSRRLENGSDIAELRRLNKNLVTKRTRA